VAANCRLLRFCSAGRRKPVVPQRHTKAVSRNLAVGQMLVSIQTLAARQKVAANQMMLADLI